MAHSEPEIPVTQGDLPEDPKEIQAKTNPVKDDSKVDKAGEDDKSKQEAKKDEESSSQVSSEQYKQLVEGWKEDREYYQGEIKRLRSEATNPKLTEKEEDELNGLDENERVEKLIEFRDKRISAANDAEVKQVQSEIRFYERTDPEFKNNKNSILKVAADYDCPNLKQAVLIWRGLNHKKLSKDTEYNDNRKKEADGNGGGKSAGKTTIKPYDAKTDGKKSIGDLYRAGGIN